MKYAFVCCLSLSRFLFILIGLLYFSIGLAFAQTNLQQGLLACYPFSGNANDTSGNTNHGAVMGASLTTDRFGNTNSAYSFDGIDDYVVIPVGQLKNHFYSYSLWVNARSIPNEGETVRMLSIGGPGGDQDASLGNGYVAISKGWDGAGYNTDGTVSHYSVGSLPSLDVWYHITVTRDEGTLKLYVNGKLAGIDLTNGKLSYYGFGTTRATIGSRSTLTQYFDGSIDDIRLYNRALTAEEVELLYQAPNVREISIQSTNINPCAGSTVDFTVAPTIGGDAQYQWKVDGVPAGTNSTAFTYSFPASASVYSSLISVGMTSEASCTSAMAQMTVPVKPLLAPSVIVTTDKVSPCAGNLVQFIATPTNGGSAPLYQWKVDGENQGALTQSATFSYMFTEIDSDYQAVVEVEMTSQADCASPTKVNTQTTLQINSPKKPVVTLVAGEELHCTNKPSTFTVTPSLEGASYQWKINGTNQGGPTSSSTFIFTFPNTPSDYTVSVDVSFDNPCTLPVSAQKSVIAASPLSILLTLSANNQQACAGKPVTFLASPTIAGATYRWKINGVDQGINANASIFTHTFPEQNQPYEATVTVEVDSDQRCITPASEQTTVTVFPKPTLSCPFPAIAEKGVSNRYAVKASGGQASYRYQWIFGSDTVVVNGKDTLSYTYASEGTYDVEVRVTDSKGCQSVCRATQKVIRPLIFPNVFTPNGDQHNETFTIQYEGNDFGMRIYNRWGRLVAETANGLYGWDGKGFPTGLYYYQITIASKEYKGWVSLLR